MLATLIFSGCNRGAQKPSAPGDVWSDPAGVPLLDPLQGRWLFDQEKTFALWQKEGVPQEEIATTRSFLDQMKKASLPADVERQIRSVGVNPDEMRATLGRLHPDITIDGHIATCDGTPRGEYRFYALHRHGQRVCGKAWHHEDRFDPGDMSKCYARLAIIGGELHLAVRMKEGLPVNDPDLIPSPPILADAAAPCDADAPPETDWSNWQSFVFVRPGAAKQGR